MSNYNFESIRDQWSSNAESLADFVMKKLVNRTDAYGGHRDPRDRIAGAAIKQNNPLSSDVIQRHFKTGDRRDLIRLHTVSPQKTSRWIVLEIDQPHGVSHDCRQMNEEGAKEYFKHWPETVSKPLLIDSDGRGGFQLWVILNSPISVANACAFGHHIAEYSGALGLGGKPEVFPEHPSSIPEQLPSRSVCLPGLHHAQDFYSRVWDGEKWLIGCEAIDFICNYPLLDPNDLELTQFTFEE
jgi:hypothetical protein